LPPSVGLSSAHEKHLHDERVEALAFDYLHIAATKKRLHDRPAGI